MTSTYAEWLQREERRVKQRSRLYTGIVLVLFLAFLLLYPLIRDTVPPAGENQYTTIGRVDFGNLTEGSGEVNTTDPPANSPAEAQPQPQPTQETQPTTPTTNQDDVVTTERPSPTQTQSSQPTPTQPAEPRDQVDNPMLFDGGGSNDGNSNQIGNEGQPGSQLSDGNGLFWGDGDGAAGLGGRRLLNRFDRPPYDVPEEGKVTFELTVAPNGQVTNVKRRRLCKCPVMIPRIEKKLYELRFNPVPGGRTEVYTVSYTLEGQ